MNRQRGGSAGIDSKVYRETVARMRQEVLESKAETQKVQDQLNCLIHLMKRAWLGDETASVHVAHIIGVAPPNVVKETSRTEPPMSTFITEPKPRAINNWAMLTIGLLNKFYKLLERQAEEEARRRLTTRIDYLEELLIHHKSMIGDSVPRRYIKSVGDVDREFMQQRVRDQRVRESEEKEKQLKRRNPVHHHLYRPASGKSTSTSKQYDLEDDLVDMFVQPLKDNKHMVTNGNSDERLRNTTSNRYVTPGLFEPGELIPDRERGKRPASAKIQQQADDARARPKSAVLPKSERPMKYETTRPISAKVASSRTKSAKGNRTSEEKKKVTHVYFPVETTSQFAHRDTVSDDLKKVQLMEEEFRQTTKLLQQKLGISQDGAI